MFDVLAQTAEQVPPIEERIGQFVGHDAQSVQLQGAINQARNGEFGKIYGTQGSFAGFRSVGSDRTQLETYFNEHGQA